jgi:protein-L-isoaspartate O-methyltransferase
MIFFFFLIVFLSIVVVLGLLSLGHFLQQRISFLHDPVYVPSREEAIERMIQLAQPKKGMQAIDFGSGNGVIVIALAKLGCQVIGYEIQPLLVRASRKKIEELGLQDAAEIKSGSFWKADVSGCDVVFLYMTASIMQRLEKKLLMELKPGARVVSQEFKFPTWKVEKKVGNVCLYVKREGV